MEVEDCGVGVGLAHPVGLYEAFVVEAWGWNVYGDGFDVGLLAPVEVAF